MADCTVSSDIWKITEKCVGSHELHLVSCLAQLVERRSLTSELSLSCARPAADGYLCTYVGKLNCPL